MRKLKVLIASMIGAMALVFASIVSLNAATLTETYNFDISAYADDADGSVKTIVDGHSGTLSASGENDSTKEMDLTISAGTVGSNGIYYSTSNTDLRVTKTGTSSDLRFSFEFISEGDATISFEFNSSGSSKYVEYWVDDATSATGSFAAGSLTAKSISVTGAGNHVISWHGTNTTSSDVKFKDISILDHYEKDVTTYDVTLDYSIDGVDDVVTTVEENGNYTLPKPTNKVLGSTFIGWKSSLDDNVYDAGEDFVITSAVTFTAQWQANVIGSGHIFDASNAESGTYTSNSVMINNTIFTTYATSDKSVSIEGASITGANGESFTKKMVLGGKSTISGSLARCIGFTAPTDGVIKVQFVTGSNGKSRSAQIFDASSTSSALASGSNSNSSVATEFSYAATKGKTYLVGSNTDTIVLLYVKFEQKADGTTAAVFAEKNSTGDTLRFIGGMSGINDLDDIASIELILKKDGVATKKQIFLTTCYTSVTGASQPCPASPENGVYYVIYRITGVTGLTGTISKQLKVTFTDGSTLLSDVTEIVLA